MKAAAEHFGLRVGKDGFIRCPFHNDKHPSMKLYKDNYHCFACLAHGDVISLTAQIFGISQYEAAKKLAADFGVDIQSRSKPTGSHNIPVKEARELLTEYIYLLECIRDKYCPAAPSEEWHPLFAESLHQLPLLQYYLELLEQSSWDEQKQFISEERRMFDGLRNKIIHARMAV